jgi:hypothetical protein
MNNSKKQSIFTPQILKRRNSVKALKIKTIENGITDDIYATRKKLYVPTTKIIDLLFIDKRSNIVITKHVIPLIST